MPGPPACVAPSTAANNTEPAAYSFVAKGCVVDQLDNSAFVNEPVDVFVTSPSVTLRNTKLTASFAVDTGSVLRGAGALTADDVLIGTAESGAGAGELNARLVPP